MDGESEWNGEGGHTTKSVFAQIPRCIARAVRCSITGITALAVITLAIAGAVRAHCAFFARSADTGSSIATITVIGAH